MGEIRYHRHAHNEECQDSSLSTLMMIVYNETSARVGCRSTPAATTKSNLGHRDTWHYWQVVEAQMEYQRRFAQSLDHADGGPFDLILCPATALPAWTHGAGQNLVLAGAYTALYNVLGYPAGVVPVTRVRAGE